MTSYQEPVNGVQAVHDSPLRNGRTITKPNRQLNGPRPRLCHLHAWPDYEGYGFSLCARKGSSGQFVFQVELGSPADLGGLRNGDRIVEVNGTNVSSENHKQIVERILSVEGQTVLLVVDATTDKFFSDRRLVISGANLDNIDVIESPTSKPHRHPSDSVQASQNTSVDDFVCKHPPEFRLRLCHVTRWPNFEGYGFMMHTLKDLPGQFIGSVSQNSPAENAGLRPGDRIIEVNGVNVEGDFHNELAAKIQSVIGQVSLLVVDSQSDKYFHEKDVALHSGQPFVDRLQSKYIRAAFPDDIIDSCPHRLRMCHLRLANTNPQQQKSPEADVIRPPCYGFTLRTGSDDGRAGQFVGAVDRDSVAERSGLRAGDRLIEVNGMNVETASHLDVIERVRSVVGQTKLLVVDAEMDKFLQERGVSLLYGVPHQLITRLGEPPDGSPTTSPQPENNQDALETNNNDNSTMQNHPHRLRLCRLTLSKPPEAMTSANSTKSSKRSTGRPDPSEKTSTDNGGYGFTVHAELRRSGHPIGKVEPGSSAERSGIRTGDRIIEVDGRNVEVESHVLLAELINAARSRRRPDSEDGQLDLLVADSDAYKYFTERGLELSSKQPYVERHGFEQTSPRDVHSETKTLAVIHSEVAATSGRLRLCQLKRWPDYDGYGFVLLAEQSRSGSYVGRVEKGSPAESGGLRPGDRIVEVNNVNVEHESHSAVADRIQAVTGLLEILVVDDQSDRYFDSQHIATLDRNQPFVETVVCPDRPAQTNNNIDGTIHRTSDDEIKEMTEKFRFCHLKTRADFDGYGFDVITERCKPLGGHYIGKVDRGSPAEEAGLRNGDLVVEVNGVRVVESSRCSHEQLAVHIKTHSDHVTMLVVDQVTEKWYRQRGLPLVDTRSVVTTTSADIEKTDNNEHTPEDVHESNSIEPLSTAAETSTTESELAQPVSPASESNTASQQQQQQHPHRMRLCKLRRWPNYSGYGFNLHFYGGGGSSGQTASVADKYVIGAVESGSPAEAGGLRRGDRLVAVNGQQVVAFENGENDLGGQGQGHGGSTLDAVAMIKARPDRVNLLVVDPEAQAYFMDRGLPLDGQQPYIDVIKTAEHGPDQHMKGEISPAPAQSASPESDSVDTAGDGGGPPLFSGSAREARQRMPRKLNVKNMNISLHEKYELFETM